MPRSSCLLMLALAAVAPTASLHTCARLAVRPLLAPRMALLPRRQRADVVALAEDDDTGSDAYRTLGIVEDASYDDIMDAYIALSETYADDPARIAKLEAAKEKARARTRSQRVSQLAHHDGHPSRHC